MIEIPLDLLEACYVEGINAYPEEACGMLSGRKDDPLHLNAIHPMKNLMNEYHAQDPVSYPRTNRNAYMIDPREQMKLERSLKKQGDRVKVIYHSHPDVGAYFSEKDQADALWNGEPRHPDVCFLVCGITNKKPVGSILVNYNKETQSFDVTEL
jgi:proteasome lid subunit RPN8/RPN11